MSCSVWPPSLLEAAFFFCYSSTALAGGYSCVTLTPYPLSNLSASFWSVPITQSLFPSCDKVGKKSLCLFYRSWEETGIFLITRPAVCFGTPSSMKLGPAPVRCVAFLLDDYNCCGGGVYQYLILRGSFPFICVESGLLPAKFPHFLTNMSMV